MQLWAIFWHIRTLTDQPIALGGVGLARILPVIIFSLIGGAIADTLNRRRIMLVTQTSLALPGAGTRLADPAGRDQPGLDLCPHRTAGGCGSLRPAGAPGIGTQPGAARDLPNAFSLNSIAAHTGSIIGPALSGWVIAGWGLSYVYLINAVSFLAVILALLLIGPVAARKPSRHRRLPGPGRDRWSAWKPFRKASPSLSNTRSSCRRC